MGKRFNKQQADEVVKKELPLGVKLVHTLRGHKSMIWRIAWAPDGRTLASPSEDGTIRLWDAETGKCLRTFKGHNQPVECVAFDPNGRVLASGSEDNTINLWDLTDGKLLHRLEGHSGYVRTIAFDPTGHILASGSTDDTVKLWETTKGKLIRSLKHTDNVNSVVFDSAGRIIASGGDDDTVTLWESASGKKLRMLKGHQSWINSIEFIPSECAFASASADKTIMIWDQDSGTLLRRLEAHADDGVKAITFASDFPLMASLGGTSSGIFIWNCKNWEIVANILEKTQEGWFSPTLAFHPSLPLLASVGSDPGTPNDKLANVIHVYELDLSVLLNQHTSPMVTYTSAKIVLVGDSGVGKTGLGWRLAHGEFKEHSSTHGQQFWLLNQLCNQRRDGAQCEAVLWDLAGQPDYRLIHALFLDDADLALILFDPTRDDDLLTGVEFWLKQLNVGTQYLIKTPTILTAARSDRGTPRLTQEELEDFCQHRSIAAYLPTSAKSGEGIDELIQEMQNIIPWDAKPSTVTTEAFKRIKEFVLNLKEGSQDSYQSVILTLEELRLLLGKMEHTWKYSDAEMLTAVRHLENHGYVKLLMTSQGELRILLRPELLNNLAASFILEARRNQKGLGSLEEQQLLSGEYKFPELEKLTDAEKDIMLDSAVVLFLEHNICFRETDPLNCHSYLIFPELINLKKPMIGNDSPLEDGVAYTVSGAVENVYASLVVLMGYTQTFTRTNQWKNHARYEVGKGLICGFRLEEERAGELDFVLYFGTDTPTYVRTLFKSLFESFLELRNLTVRRYEPVVCPKGHTLNRVIVRQKMSNGIDFAFCSDCGEKIIMPKVDQPIILTKKQEEEVEVNRRVADSRSLFEKVLFRLKSYMMDKGIAFPECFISYAWGNSEQERWVERSLARDLQKAGINVVLDRWENSRIGASMPRFVDRVERADRVIVVGTPLYRQKYENNEPMRSFVVAAEGDLIGKRMIGTEEEKESVLPVLLEGTEKSAFPPLLQGRIYADFRTRETYFSKAFELLLSLYNIQPNNPVAIELRETLISQRER